MSVDPDYLTTGSTYVVKMDDCCIAGEFTSLLTSIEYEEDDTDKEFPTYRFANGVRLDRAWQVSFEDVTADEAARVE